MHRVLLHCAECDQIRAFEAPPCADGHGDDCPERACAECGCAVFVGLIPPAAEPAPREHERQTRRAA
jgi:hypothetical protein